MYTRVISYTLLGTMVLNHDGKEHPQSEAAPPNRQCIFDTCITAVTSTTTTPNPADRQFWMSGCNR